MKKHLLLPLVVLLLACLMSACDNTGKKAAQKLELATQAFNQGRYDEAQAQIDSIKLLYPKAFEVRKAGNRLMRKVELARQQHTVAYLDSLLSSEQAKLEQMKPRYAFEKDEEYQQTGIYFHPSQVIEKNLHRSFLRFQVNERGTVSMTSIYCGRTPIHHTAVRVTAPDGTYAQTPTSPDSYETTDLGEHIEKADYKLGADGDVISFVTLHKDKNLQVEFLGDRTYKTSLTRNDRQAASAIQELGQVLTSIAQIQSKLEECHVKIRFLEERMKKDSLETDGN